MLDNYRYEQTILKTATKLIQHDMHNTTKDLCAARIRPLAPKGGAGLVLCGLCSQPPHAPAMAASVEDDERARQLMTPLPMRARVPLVLPSSAHPAARSASAEGREEAAGDDEGEPLQEGQGGPGAAPSSRAPGWGSAWRAITGPLQSADVYVQRLVYLQQNAEPSRLPLLLSALREDKPPRALRGHRAPPVPPSPSRVKAGGGWRYYQRGWATARYACPRVPKIRWFLLFSFRSQNSPQLMWRP